MYLGDLKYKYIKYKKKYIDEKIYYGGMSNENYIEIIIVSSTGEISNSTSEVKNAITFQMLDGTSISFAFTEYILNVFYVFAKKQISLLGTIITNGQTCYSFYTICSRKLHHNKLRDLFEFGPLQVIKTIQQPSEITKFLNESSYRDFKYFFLKLIGNSIVEFVNINPMYLLTMFQIDDVILNIEEVIDFLIETLSVKYKTEISNWFIHYTSPSHEIQNEMQRLNTSTKKFFVYFFLKVLSSKNNIFYYFPNWYTEKDIRILVVELSGMISDATEFNDPEIMLIVIKKNPEYMYNAGQGLRTSHDFMMRAVKISPLALKYASQDIKSSREVVLEAVKRDGTALYHAADILKSDYEIVMKAVEQNGMALGCASMTLRANENIVRKAMENNPNSSMYSLVRSQ